MLTHLECGEWGYNWFMGCWCPLSVIVCDTVIGWEVGECQWHVDKKSSLKKKGSAWFSYNIENVYTVTIG
jgi:hypothetical protein